MPSRQMISSRITLITLFLGLLLVILPTIVSAEPSIEELVAGIDEKALHAALHESANGKYKHGVFEGDTHAIKAVHRSNPVEAKRIINLARRQTNGTVAGSNIVIAFTTHISSIHTSTTIASAYTKTLANGERQTSTSYILVEATDVADQAPPASATVHPPSVTTGKPSLQTNSAPKLSFDGVFFLSFIILIVGGMIII